MDKNSLVSPLIAKTLGKLGKKSEIVQPLIVEWIEKHQDSENVGNGIDASWDMINAE